MFYNARWYDPSLSRFTSADSIVPAGVQGYDRFAYVSNNPVRYVDPSGHMETSSCGELAGGCHVNQQIIDNDLAKANNFRQRTDA